MNTTNTSAEISALLALTRPWQIHSIKSLNGTCFRNYTAKFGDTCLWIETQFNITPTQFYQWNPTLHENCSNLLAGHSYCVDNLQPQRKDECQSASTVLLWFTSMFTFTAIWVLLLGSRDVRRYIDKEPGRSWTLSRKPYLRCAIGLLGSLILQIGFTALTARILTRGQMPIYEDFLSILMGWFLRPLPALSCLLVIAFDRKRFNQGFQEMLVIESVIALFPLAHIWCVMVAIPPFTSTWKSYLTIFNYRTASHLLFAGAVLAIVASILCASIVVILVLWWSSELTDRPWKVGYVMKFRVWCLGNILLVFGFGRIASGFLLWSGALMLDPVAFCPNSTMMRNVTLLWAFAPAVDNLWRSFFHFRVHQ